MAGVKMSEQNTKNKGRVLIVEDEFLISLALSQQLTNLGYQVVGTARDGAAGVKETLRLQPDVVLMDIGLPELDGIEAMKKILAGSQATIVMLSAYEDEQRLSEAEAAGAAGYILKPATQRQISDTLEKVLRNKQ
jgi:two-component system, response regulator PdtaR